MENQRFFAKSLGAEGQSRAAGFAPLLEAERASPFPGTPPSPQTIISSVCLSQPCPSSLANLTKWEKHDM